MNSFLVQLGSMSLQASVAILVVLVLRKIFAKAGVSKKYAVLLWMIPFFLLLCPWKISTSMGFWQTAPSDYDEEYTEYAMERFAESFLITEREQVQMPVMEDAGNEGGITQAQTTVEEGEGNYYFTEADKRMIQNILIVAEVVWMAGAIAFLGYAFFSYVLLRKKVSCNVKRPDDTYIVDELPAPMVLGFVRPRIYLPSGMDEAHVPYVTAHERTHIRRKDPLIKLVAYILVCVHWFNPLVWVAFHFLEKDMEMACDEETIQQIGAEQKQEYATALLQLSVGTRSVFAVPLAFGEGDTKGRIKNVMHYKKTVKSAAILAVATGILIFAVFMTKQDYTALLINDPQKEQNELSDSELEEIEWAESEALEQLKQIEDEQTRLEQEQEALERELELTFAGFRKEAENHTLHELDFHSYKNGEEKHFEDGQVLNYYINFEFEYEGELYRVEASHMIEDDSLNTIYVTRLSDGEMRWIYRNKDGENTYSDYLEPLLATKEDVNEWLSVTLPDGYSLGSYHANRGLEGGALISPQAYEVYDWAVMAPEEWYYAGFLGKISYAQDYFIFENGQLVDGEIHFWNHSSVEKLGVLDLDWQALMVHQNHDLYTASTAWDLVEAGIDIEQVDTTSDYWYFFFAKEGEDTAYYLSLSQNLFTKEEAIAIAETVDIKE